MDFFVREKGKRNAQPNTNQIPTHNQSIIGRSISKSVSKPDGNSFHAEIGAHLAHEWDEMMFAKGEHFDIAHDHHFVVVFVEDGIVENICGKGEQFLRGVNEIIKREASLSSRLVCVPVCGGVGEWCECLTSKQVIVE